MANPTGGHDCPQSSYNFITPVAGTIHNPGDLMDIYLSTGVVQRLYEKETTPWRLGMRLATFRQHEEDAQITVLNLTLLEIPSEWDGQPPPGLLYGYNPGPCNITQVRYTWKIPNELVWVGDQRYQLTAVNSSSARNYTFEQAFEGSPGNIYAYSVPFTIRGVKEDVQKSLNIGAIVAIAIVVGIVVGLVTAITAYCLKEKRKEQTKSRKVEDGHYVKPEIDGLQVDNPLKKPQELSEKQEIKELDSRSPLPELHIPSSQINRNESFVGFRMKTKIVGN